MSETAEGVRVQLADGSVVVGANLEEAFNNLKTMKENASSAKLQAEQERDSLQQENERLRQQQEEWERAKQREAELAAQSQPASFDSARYYELLNGDPIAAQNYIDQWRFGVPDPVAAFNGMAHEISTQRLQLDQRVGADVATAFIATHPEWPHTAEAARLMRERVEQLNAQGFPFNVTTADYAYRQLVSEGAISPVNLEPEEPIEAPPSLTGGGGGSLSLPDPDSMSDRDLETLLRSRGMVR